MGKTTLVSTTFASVAAILAVTTPTRASAQGIIKNWTGCHIGLEGGAAMINDKVTATDIHDPNDITTLDGAGASGGTLGITGGCDYQFSQYIVVGAFADWDDLFGMGSSLTHTFNQGGQNFFQGKLDFDDQWAIGGRAGVLVQPNVLAYGLVAYTQMNPSDLNLHVGTNDYTFSVSKFTGVAVGGGLETEIAKSLHLGLEYRFTDYGSKSTQVYCEDIAFRPEVQTVRATLTWQFTDLFGGQPPVSYAPPLK